MKVILFNDTRNYHSGCEWAMQYLCTDIVNSGFDLVKTFHTRDDYELRDLDDCDVLIVNGEGSMHHNRENGIRCIEALRHAQNKGKKTLLINTVWQAMANELVDDVLERLDFVSVRETLSQYELREKHGRESEVFLDLSYFANVPYEEKSESDIVHGAFFARNPLDEDYYDYPRHSLLDESWVDFVNVLRASRVLITGRHHEVYAACKAKCLFAVLRGNTHKIEGLFDYANVVIPCGSMRAGDDEVMSLVSSVSKQCVSLSNFMDSCKPFTLSSVEM